VAKTLNQVGNGSCLTTRSRRTVMHRGRSVLAMDCVLAGAEWHCGRPLNSVVSHQAETVPR